MLYLPQYVLIWFLLMELFYELLISWSGKLINGRVIKESEENYPYQNGIGRGEEKVLV